jgi:hypothetical protein
MKELMSNDELWTMDDKKKRRYGLQMGLNAPIKVEEVWRENQPKSC